MRKRWSSLGFILFIVLAAGRSAADGEFTAASEPPPGMALVYLYRLDVWPPINTPANFRVGDSNIAVLPPNAYTWFHVPEGGYRIEQTWDWPRKSDGYQAHLNARAGGIYYLKLEVDAGLQQMRYRFVPVQTSAGSREIERCRFQPPQADAVWKPLLANREANSALVRANSHFSSGQFAESLAAADEVLRSEPENAQAYFLRGASYGRLSKYDLAIRDLEESIRRDPNSALAYNSLAWVLATAKQSGVRDGDRAVELAWKAGELTKWRVPEIMDTLAAAYARKGDFARAVAWQDTALENPYLANREEAEARLKFYRLGYAWPD